MALRTDDDHDSSSSSTDISAKNQKAEMTSGMMKPWKAEMAAAEVPFDLPLPYRKERERFKPRRNPMGGEGGADSGVTERNCSLI